jgi:hypothetical protein
MVLLDFSSTYANIILHEQSEAKGIKKGIKCFCHPFMDGRACIYLSVSVSVCLSGLKSGITFDGMKGYWWNFQDQSNSVQVIFGRGVSDQLASRVHPWAKNGMFLENLSNPWVFVLQGCDIPFGYLRPRARKCREPNFDFLG